MLREPKVIVDATEEPITLVEARMHLRLDAEGSPAAHPEDALVTALITAAREHAEKFTGRTIARKTLELALDSFPVSPGTSAYLLAMEIPAPPLLQLQSVIYTDADGEHAFTGYQLDTYSEPPRLLPDASSSAWPITTSGQANSVRIRYLAGYTLPGDSPDLAPLPKSIKQAMLLHIGHLYENRQAAGYAKLDVLPMGVESLLRPYRVLLGLA